jgi:hypothetical protein
MSELLVVRVPLNLVPVLPHYNWDASPDPGLLARHADATSMNSTYLGNTIWTGGHQNKVQVKDSATQEGNTC